VLLLGQVGVKASSVIPDDAVIGVRFRGSFVPGNSLFARLATSGGFGIHQLRFDPLALGDILFLIATKFVDLASYGAHRPKCHLLDVKLPILPEIPEFRPSTRFRKESFPRNSCKGPILHSGFQNSRILADGFFQRVAVKPG